MRAGVAFPHRQAGARTHLDPLLRRLRDLLVTPVSEAAVAVHAEPLRPVRGAWNVQLFQGVLEPFTLPRAALRRRRGLLGPRQSRYHQVNAHGRRSADRLARLMPDAQVTRFGPPALNEHGPLRPDPAGPVLWLPAGAADGGAKGSGLALFAAEVARVAREVPFAVRRPAATRGRAEAAALRLLGEAPGVEVAPAHADVYALLRGARAVLTDHSPLALEAHALGHPVAIARPPGPRPAGLLGELEERAPVLHPARPGLEAWAARPEPPSGAAWSRDILDAPSPERNDAFAAQLRQKVVERASGRRW